MNEELPIDALSAALPPEFDDLRADIERFLVVKQMRQPSKETCAIYERASARMGRRKVFPEEIGERSRRSFHFYRAALVYMVLTKLESNCRLACSGHDDILTIRTKVIGLLRGLNRYPPDGGGQSKWKHPEAGVVRKGKRNGMGRIPKGGLARLVAAFADDPVYADPLRVLFLTGARPSEVVKGIEVELTAHRHLRFTIRGTKVTNQTGQPVRMIEVAINNAAAQALAMRAAAGVLVVRITDARKLSDRVRSMSMRLFPRIGYVISPYTFRHALAAGEKKRGRSVDSLAKVLGHVSGRSQRAYGTPQQGQHLPGGIWAADAERLVRNTDLSRWSEVVAALKKAGAAPARSRSSETNALAKTPATEPAP